MAQLCIIGPQFYPNTEMADMKLIDVDDELYQYIASQTQQIGESASDILRRLLLEQTVPAVTTLTPKSSACSTLTSVSQPPASGFLDEKELQQQKGVIGRFLYILAALHEDSPAQFARVLDIKGRDRLYFATSKEALLAAGSSTNPKQIPGTDYWVISNNNTTKKRAILDEVCDVFGIANELKARLSQAL